MATDAEILTASRAHYAAIAAVLEADEVVRRLQGELQKAGQISDEKRKYAKECERILIQKSMQKPSEPPPKPVEEKLPVPEPVREVVVDKTPVAAGPVPTLPNRRR